MAWRRPGNKQLSEPTMVSLLTHIGHCASRDLTHKLLEVHWCIVNTVATDGLVLKHQAIIIPSIEQISTLLGQIRTKILYW